MQKLQIGFQKLQAVESNWHIYVNDSSLLIQHNEVTKINKQLTKDFNNIFD